jgi:hypothetical protein
LGSQESFVLELRRTLDPMKDLQRKFERLSDYESGLRRKYERAATRPWLEIPADPPPPS